MQQCNVSSCCMIFIESAQYGSCVQMKRKINEENVENKRQWRSKKISMMMNKIDLTD